MTAFKRPTFRTLYCSQHGCRDEDFERVLHWQSLHHRGRPLAFLIKLFHPAFFEVDYQILRQFGEIESRGSFMMEAHQVRDDYKRVNAFGFLRKHLWVRISGQRLLRVAEEVWHGRSLEPVREQNEHAA